MDIFMSITIYEFNPFSLDFGIGYVYVRNIGDIPIGA